MLKLLGSALILGAGAWLRWNTLAQQRRQRQTLRALLGALRRMAEEIRMGPDRPAAAADGWPGSADRTPPFCSPAQRRRCGEGSPWRPSGGL